MTTGEGGLGPVHEWARILAFVDLTSLDDDDTPERIRALCARARRPDPDDPSVPPVAAVCVLPRLIRAAVGALADSPVRVAAVAGDFPTGTAPLATRLTEIVDAVAAGAAEVDVVLNRGLLLADRTADLTDELQAIREAAAGVVLKVILETGQLGSHEGIRRATLLAADAGADFVKTSTGKMCPGATPEATRVMMLAARDFHTENGRAVGIKIAGGVRTAASALAYVQLLRATLGEAWERPDRFRIGASGLLDDLLRASHASAAF
jgi:deoxyribose-phosphate aldolase